MSTTIEAVQITRTEAGGSLAAKLGQKMRPQAVRRDLELMALRRDRAAPRGGGGVGDTGVVEKDIEPGLDRGEAFTTGL
ncbi:hypothetical protein N7508_001867 [Penicillium antarcticum]|uniref:uncharacterized protein n=1 Tax=Penicillium antarcticum TaxID=416450 RepID=UPI0023965A88|nr:uncharacterized protein N7508_001867 [Penicillium antarcticum]KAJ5317359.1 hypothetical protein N7508_001867 [Penicillium antarcticum]